MTNRGEFESFGSAGAKSDQETEAAGGQGQEHFRRAGSQSAEQPMTPDDDSERSSPDEEFEGIKKNKEHLEKLNQPPKGPATNQ